MKRIKALVVGCGNMGRIGVRYLLDKGIEIVGAYGVNPATLGMDLGSVAGLPEPLGIKIRNDLEALIEETSPDVAVHAMYSTMKDNEEVFSTLLRHGVNIVTTCDDSHYAWDVERETSERLDRIAKKGNATLVGTGIQDVFFLNLGYVAAGAAVSLKEIEVNISNNLDDYGLTSAKGAGAGLSADDFKKKFEGPRDAQSAMTGPINSAICDKFGLTPIKNKLSQVPYTKDHSIYSNALTENIPAGYAVGITETMETVTVEGIIVRSRYDIYIYDDGEIDVTAWHLRGKPDINIEVPNCKTPEGTMATLVNRIPDAINAASGYIPDSNLPSVQFHIGDITLK